MKNDITHILYLCDRKKCGDNCDYPLCSHTTDIAHAASFRKTPYDTVTGKTVTTYTEKLLMMSIESIFLILQPIGIGVQI